MDAVEIMKAFGQMCSIEGEYGCSGCALSYEFNGTGETCGKFIGKNPKKAVEIIKRWVADGQYKTNS